MPTASKVSWAQLRVGITAIIALTLIGVLIYLLTGTTGLFLREAIVYTYFGDAAAVAVGAPVRVNGINTGNVKRVSLSGSTDPARIVRIELAIDEKMLKEIPVDSTATVSAETLLGSKFVNIKKGRAQVTIKPGAEIPSQAAKEIFEIMDSFFPLLTSAQQTLKRIDNIVSMVESGKGNIGKLIVDETLFQRVDSILSEVQRTTTSVNSGRGTLSRLLYEDALYNDIRAPIQRMDRLLQGIEEGKGTAGKLLKDPSMYDEIQRNLVLMRLVLEDIQAGKGTAGRLLKSDDVHTQITSLLKKIDATVDKINSGQGTLGQLLVNPQLYESINSTTRELNGLLKDFRANPKKFLRIKLGLF